MSKNAMRKAMTIALAVALVGCATVVKKEYLAISGSKADGRITLGYDYTDMEIPEVDETDAYNTALRRCQNWGYEDVESFDVQKEQTGVDPFWGTEYWRVTRDFQCID